MKSSKWILILLMPLLACTSVQSQKGSVSKNEYLNYDSLRPDFPDFNIDSLKVSNTEDRPDSIFIENNGLFSADNSLEDSLQILMDTLAKLNNSVPYYGYRIVLYTGPDRKRAIYERGRAVKLLDENTEVYMNYQRPYFKVKVGNFYNRTTAYATFLELKSKIPTALLVPEIIDLKKIQFE